VALKPSETTPVTTVMLAEAAAEYLPPGVINVVVGDRSTGAALVEHPCRGGSRAHRIGRVLDFGQIWVNCHLIQAAEMPNGGFGLRARNDLSMMALEDYTRAKHIMTALP
jgi:acyl-CoA reductase-like NAD-dependent aldehyde dehydrogenase